MLISEKAVRIFARSILFENNENVDLNEMNLSPSNGGIGLGANDLYKVPPSHDKPLEQKDWQEKVVSSNKDDNLIDVNDISSLAPHESIPPDLEDKGCRNPGDFKVKVSLELDKVGLNAENEDLDSALNKITKVIRGML
jgi:hypothetical protein